MAEPDMSIMTELIKEVESYLPDMSKCLRILSDGTSGQKAIIHEFYRMTHTIKGASSMVKLNELSDTAAIMENTLDDIFAGKKEWSQQIIDLLADTVGRIGSHCTALHKGNDPADQLYQITSTAFEEIPNSVSEDFDEAVSFRSREEPISFAVSDDSYDEEDELMGELFSKFPGESTGTGPGDDLDSLFAVHKKDSADPDCTIESEKALPVQPSGIDPELQECFNEEIAEHFENLGYQLNTLFSSITARTTISEESREILHSIRRSVHTMKGAAAVIGVKPVAAWGHEFEDFLDWLHDEGAMLSPRIVSVMLEATDIMEKIAENPDVDVAGEIIGTKETFSSIIHDSSIEAGSDRKENTLSEPVESTVYHVQQKQKQKQKRKSETPVSRFATIRPARTKIIPKKNTNKSLRVGTEKLASLMGMSGDMSVTLSSFENSISSMQSSMEEFEATLKRLKSIASSLDAGYELASIPHMGTIPGVDQDEYGVSDEFDPLEMDRYSELHILIRSLNEAVVDLDSIREQTSEAQESWRQSVDRQGRIVKEVQGMVQSMQMTPFSTLANRLHKTVRETARTTGKNNVRLVIEGETIEMDVHIWDVLVDALMHMLRNAVDHGVETEENRQQAGKSEQAEIRINCSRRGSRFILHFSDDGSGLDYDAIRLKIAAQNPALDVGQMDNKELASHIFTQGFSSKTELSTISGRGVGMDVVRNAVAQLNGSISIQSTPGQGTDFILSIPIVVAQLSALMVRFGTEQFVVPMRDVIRVVSIPNVARIQDEVEIDGESLPLLDPVKLLQLKGIDGSTDYGPGSKSLLLALVVETGERRGALVADAIIGRQEIVFKSLGPLLQNVPCIAGATIMGDGSLVPILQVEDLFDRKNMPSHSSHVLLEESIEGRKVLEVLVVDDSISVRKVLSSFISRQGWHPMVAHDGVDAMEKIRVKKPDLILLDIEMPRMNGFEVLRALQSQSTYRAIPVLMLSSRSAVKYKNKAIELGAMGFVTKPFKDDELLSLINTLCISSMRSSMFGGNRS